MFDEHESFLKVGLTSATVKKRFGNIIYMPCQYVSLLEITTDPYFAYTVESVIQDYLREYSYRPALIFEGFTECFHIDAIESINSLLKANNKPTISLSATETTKITL